MIDNIPPIIFQWDGEAFWPRHPKIADKHYVVGEIYALIPHNQRSSKSHNHYFACVTEAWKNLPEEYAERFPTDEHLRKWALIKAGFYDRTDFVASSKAEAVRIAAMLRPIDDTAVVIVKDCVVARMTAKSQRYRAMGKADFQASKEAVLDIVAGLAQTTPAELKANAGESA